MSSLLGSMKTMRMFDTLNSFTPQHGQSHQYDLNMYWMYALLEGVIFISLTTVNKPKETLLLWWMPLPPIMSYFLFLPSGYQNAKELDLFIAPHYGWHRAFNKIWGSHPPAPGMILQKVCLVLTGILRKKLLMFWFMHMDVKSGTATAILWAREKFNCKGRVVKATDTLETKLLYQWPLKCAQ